MVPEKCRQVEGEQRKGIEMTTESFYLFTAIFLTSVTAIILGATLYTYRVRDRHFQEAKKRVDERHQKISERLQDEKNKPN